MSDDPVSYRHFEKHEQADDERHKVVMDLIEKIKTTQQVAKDDVTTKHNENKSEFKDIKLLLTLLILATAPQLVTFISRLMGPGGAH